MIEHIDETGAVCERHRASSPAGLYQLAMVGSRAPAFHHDCASKLQGLLMALDELTELAAEHGDVPMQRAIESAMEVSRELNGLLNLNRALTKPVVKAPTGLRDLLKAAADRVGVQLQGVIPDVQVKVGAAAMTHALALIVDVAAGTGRGRSLVVTVETADGEVEATLSAAGTQPSNASESLGIATFVVERDGGKLWCAVGGDRIVVRLRMP